MLKLLSYMNNEIMVYYDGSERSTPRPISVIVDGEPLYGLVSVDFDGKSLYTYIDEDVWVVKQYFKNIVVLWGEEILHEE